MITATKHTALLVFSLSPEAEVKRKPLFGPGHSVASRKLYELLAKHTHRSLRSVCADTFWMDESRQFGETFGERIANAMDTLFTQGYQQVVVIGNDTPDLTSGTIRHSIKLLNSHDTVLGPSKDGGAYLIGLSNEVFDKAAFTSLPWESDSLYKALEEQIQVKGGRTISLNPLTDLDSQEQLADYSALNPASFVGRFVLSFWATNPGTPSIRTLLIPSGCFAPIAGLRGPPR